MSPATFRTLLRAGVSLAACDDPAAILRRTAAGDTESFTALVGRYGPMVLGVCRRVLGPTADAEDAFQATFLALLRHGRSIRDPGALPGWLHRTALNAALRARCRERYSLDKVPELASGADPLAETSWGEVRRLLDEELNALPERLRGPLVLCYLEARTQGEAARSLGVSVSTLKRRLERGRELLRRRLLRRGIGAAGLAAGVLGGTGLAAPLSAGLFRKTALLAQGGITPAVEALAAGGKALAWSRLCLIAGCLVLAAVTAGGLILSATGDPPLPQPPTPAAGAPEVPRGDQLGDPLPEGALARLGTSRLRTERYFKFTPDGRRLVCSRTDGGLQLFEVPSGKPLARIRATDVPGRTNIIGSTIAFTPDGKHLAGVCWEGRCGIWETATGRLVRWIESGGFYSIVECDFSPDGKLLAVGGSKSPTKIDDIEVGVYEVQSGRRLFAVLGANSVFAPNGRALITWNGYVHGSQQTARRVEVPTGKILNTFSYGERFNDFSPRSDGVWFFEIMGDNAVRAWDVAAGEVKHTFRGPEIAKDGRVYVRHARGRRELLVVSTKPAWVGCWDLTTGKELWQTPLAGAAYFPPLSADGTTLVTGAESKAVQVWDAVTGKVRACFQPAAIGHVSELEVSPDGRIVVTKSEGIFSVGLAFWDAATGKRISDLPGHASDITAAVFSPDGATIYTAGKDRTLRAWEPASGRERFRASAEPWTHLAMAPDGKTLFAAGADGGTVNVLDARTGKIERKIPAFTKALVGQALTADGKQLIAAGRDGEDVRDYRVRFFDAATGTKLREFDRPIVGLEQLAVRADGTAVATTHVGRRVILWDAGGKPILEEVGRGQRVSAWARAETPYAIGSVGLSQDGRWLAYSDQEKGIAILDTRRGREVGRAVPDVYYQNGAARDEIRDVLAFSPDGKTVAWSGVESTADVFLIEARTAGVRRRLPGDSCLVRHLAFSPDGSMLISAGPDGSALVWDVFERSRSKPAAQLAAEQVAGWWDRLAEPSAEKGYQAMREMVDHPAAAVALLRDKLKPVRAVEAVRLTALLAGLDAEEFKQREAASRDLVALADAVEPRLCALLEGNPTLEVRRRAADVLERIETGRVRAERAVEVLERIGDGAARTLLGELAGGMPGAALTRDAAAAAARLSRR
jgi:RNA polymerase sigma factor (sigma-70 family)